jgi:hypothetical protein
MTADGGRNRRHNGEELSAHEDAPLVGEHAAAKFLGVSVRTLQDWRRLCRRGCPSGPAFVAVGNAIRYRLTDLDSYIESRRKSAGMGEKP